MDSLSILDLSCTSRQYLATSTHDLGDRQPTQLVDPQILVFIREKSTLCVWTFVIFLGNMAEGVYGGAKRTERLRKVRGTHAQALRGMQRIIGG